MNVWPSLQGRVCIVKGGAKGIGRSIAERFARAGASVAIADKDEESGRNTASSLQARDPQVAAFPCDVSDAESVSKMVHDVLEVFGKIDVLVNNAGVVGCCEYGQRCFGRSGSHSLDSTWHR